jgi:hypothetical protein
MTVGKRRRRVSRAGRRAAALGASDRACSGRHARDHPLPRIGPGWAAPMAKMRLMRPSFGEMNMSTSLSAASWSGIRLAHEPNMPNVSKFRATQPGIEDADAHVRLALARVDASDHIDSQKSDLRASAARLARSQPCVLIALGARCDSRPKKPRISRATSLADSSSAKCPASSRCTSAFGTSFLSAATSATSNTGS